jgi:hypothetical protein
MESVHCGLFFSPFQDPVSSIFFWGTNRFPNWVVFAVGPLKVFDRICRMGDQAKNYFQTKNSSITQRFKTYFVVATKRKRSS